MMVVDNKYSIGDIVYLITDEEDTPRMVTHIKVLPGQMLCYELTAGTLASMHWEMEIEASDVHEPNTNF